MKRVLNFSYPLSEYQLTQISTALSVKPSDLQVLDIPFQLNLNVNRLSPQIANIIQSIPHLIDDGDLEDVIVLPNYSPAAIIVADQLKHIKGIVTIVRFGQDLNRFTEEYPFREFIQLVEPRLVP